MPAHFTISLDFELHWGVFDHLRLDARGKQYFDRTRELIPPTLALFTQYGIRATWATVGILMARDKAQLLDYAPSARPTYANPAYDAYALLDTQVGNNEQDDPYHFAPSLVQRILDTPGQELGSHTFSHYYCREPGQTAATFAADLAATQAIAQDNFGTMLRSLVFPRNQYTPDYLDVLLAHGYRYYRINPEVWFWRAQAAGDESLVKKAVRLLDHYSPLPASPKGRGERVASGGGEEPDGRGAASAPTRKSSNDSRLSSTAPLAEGNARPSPARGGWEGSLPSPDRGGQEGSRFLRPYLPLFDAYGGQPLKLRRIEREMTRAARTGQDYHLWWHPHNLATDPARNMAALERILRHFRDLRERYGMESVAMSGES